MHDLDNIVQIDISTITNIRLISVRRGFSFPENYDVDNPSQNMLVIHGMNFPLVEPGKTIFVIVYTKGGDRIQYMGKVNVSASNYFNALLRIDKPHLMQERRRYFKIKANEDCLINKIVRADYTVVDTLTFPFTAYISDINLGGIFLVQNAIELDECDRCTVTLDFGPNPFTVDAEVLRKQLAANGTDIEGYGCRFVDVNAKTEDRISAYINHLQLKLRRLEREKSERF